MMMNKQIFNLTHEEQLLTDKLSSVIKEEISKSGGLIPFKRYMELALYYPGLGYYSNPRQKFGKEGDFITSPMVSSLFGNTLARQILEVINFGVFPQVLEFGAGNGKLAADILNSIGSEITSYCILELSADLIALQKETIQKIAGDYFDKVVWLNELPEKFDGVIIANEVLDAQPCELLYRKGDSIHEIGVSYTAEGKFIYKDYDSSWQADNDDITNHWTNGYQSEWHGANSAFIKTLATKLNHGVILLIDYGYGQTEYYHQEFYKGRLRGFFRHHLLDDVLIYPGLIDITTSVNWTKIATTAIDAGLDLIGYVNQAAFLINAGIAETMGELRKNLSNDEYIKLSNQVNQLVSANQMGELFKVMALSRGIDEADWCGFRSGDLSYTL
ncbi:class I SAM-dependent methyltransferase [Aquella oligotrophica]|nr:SAM-dependent methyltransferase [Aquella oligotrophica]